MNSYKVLETPVSFLLLLSDPLSLDSALRYGRR